MVPDSAVSSAEEPLQDAVTPKGRNVVEATTSAGISLLDDFPQESTVFMAQMAPLGVSVDLLGDEVPPAPVPPASGTAGCAGGAAAADLTLLAANDSSCTADDNVQANTCQSGETRTATGVDGPTPADEAPGQPPPVQASTVPHDTPDEATDGLPSTPLQSERSNPGSSVPDQDSVPVSQSLPSEHEHGPSDEASPDPDSEGEAEDPERLVDSDREVVEEEDAFGDFADFTTASHFLPGGGMGGATLPPPASASAAAASRASGPGPSSATSPSGHRHAHLGTTFPARTAHGAAGHGGSLSGAVSEHGSFAGDFSDFSHPSPPPSVVRAGGGRKSVASIASVGSRAGGDDDLGDYGSVVGSSVWRAPSQMATSSYAAAAGADDDFGDFTSDITSTSDFAPSTQPPSAVAVSGPGSVHPDDDFGSFASHRSTADDDEDDFGNFNAAPVGAAGAAGSGAGPSGAGGAGASGSGSGAAGAGGAAGASWAGPSGSSGPHAGGAGGGTGAVLSPRDAGAGLGGPASSHAAYHSTQTIGPTGSTVGDVASAGTGATAAAAESALLQLAPAELRQAVARALQPLLPSGAGPLGSAGAIAEEQWSAAWAQLQRHVATQGPRVEGSVAAQTGIPWVQVSGSAGPDAAAGQTGGTQDGATTRAAYAPAIKYTRPLRWKGSDSERRLLAALGLIEAAAQARAAEAAVAVDTPRVTGRMRSDSAGGSGLRHLGFLASFGDVPPPRRLRSDTASSPGGC